MVSHAEVTWPSSASIVQAGLVLSGDKLIDNREYRDQLIEIAPEALGGEMEGAGLYVASQTAKTDWLLIKAVCDWADGNKSRKKHERQAIASRSVAEFFVHMLKANSERLP